MNIKIVSSMLFLA